MFRIVLHGFRCECMVALMTTTNEQPTNYRVRYHWGANSSTLSSVYSTAQPAHNALAAAPPGSYIEISYDGVTWQRESDEQMIGDALEAIFDGEELDLDDIEDLEPATPIKSHVSESGDDTIAPEESTALPVTPKAGPRSVREGDWFSYSWGYDQTNVEFWRVETVTKSGKSARLRQHGSIVVSAGSGTQRVRPNADAPGAQTITKRLKLKHDGTDYIMNMDHSILSRFIDNGENTMSETAAGWGH